MEDLYLKLVKELKKTRIFDTEEVSQEIKKFDISVLEKHYQSKVDEVERHYNNINKVNNTSMTPLLDFPTLLHKRTLNVEDLIMWNKSDLINFSEFDSTEDHYVKDENMLYSAVEGVYETAQYNDELEALSMIWFRLVKNHPFSNGNKRTAIVGVKIAIMQGFADYLVKAATDYAKDAISSYLTELTPTVQKRLSKVKIKDKKISKKSVRNVINLQKSQFDKEMDDLFRKIEVEVLDHIVGNWNDFLEDDYILSIFIAQNYNHSSSHEDRDRLHELIKKNLLLFVLDNSSSLDKITDKIKSDIKIKFQKVIEPGGILTPEYILEKLKNPKPR